MPLRFLTEVIVACLCLLAQQYSLLAVSENFEETCRGEGFEIFVSARKEGKGWKVRLEPRGLSSDSRIQTFEKDSPPTRVLFEDMTGDGIQELFLIFTSPGSGSHGSVLAFSTNGKKALTDIVIDEPKAEDLEGYMGHDEFEVVENTFVRRFPVYKSEDANAKPTGGWRQFQYKLRPGEAAWHLRLDRVVSF
jgi:hypothetical protein